MVRMNIHKSPDVAQARLEDINKAKWDIVVEEAYRSQLEKQQARARHSRGVANIEVITLCSFPPARKGLAASADAEVPPRPAALLCSAHIPQPDFMVVSRLCVRLRPSRLRLNEQRGPGSQRT